MINTPYIPTWKAVTGAVHNLAVAATWQDVDISADVPANARAVLCVGGNGGAGTESGGVREDGSSETPTVTTFQSENRFVGICGVTSTRIIESLGCAGSVSFIQVIGYLS